MKHDLKITIILVLFFVLAQFIGLALVNIDIKEVKVVEGVTTIVHEETSLGPRPEITSMGAFAYIAIGLLIGTLLVLLIIRMKKIKLWKTWFFLAVFIAISLALGVIFHKFIALIIALILAILKVWKPNVFVHNITELLMYAGIAVFLVPMLNILWVAILLIIISLYDVYAVFKSKHMVRMAKFQVKSKVFAGLFIPYTPKKQSLGSEMGRLVEPFKSLKAVKKTSKKIERKNAILGGGDIAVPLIFTGVVMENLIVQGLSKTAALYQSLIITLTTMIALSLLFILAKKDKFYPAMPFITAGCFVGYVIILLL